VVFSCTILTRMSVGSFSGIAIWLGLTLENDASRMYAYPLYHYVVIKSTWRREACLGRCGMR
jgi:hypothetical protein